MQPKNPYEAAWRDLRRRCALIEVVLMLALAALLLWLPLRFWAPGVLPLVGRLQIPLAALLTASGVAVVSYGGRFRCPRCGGRFFGRERNLWERKGCSQCGLPIDTPASEENGGQRSARHLKKSRR